jgi:hypothetical protein
MLPILIVLVLLVTGCALILSLNESWRRHAAQPAAKIIYDGRKPGATPLVAHAHGLSARPTLVEQLDDGTMQIIMACQGAPPPVASAAQALWLTASAVAAEEALAIAIGAGILRYPERDILVAITPALRAMLARRIEELRQAEDGGPHLARQDPTVCRACVYHAMCPIGRVNAPLGHSAWG